MKKKFLSMLTLAILLAFGVAQGVWAAIVDSGQCGDDLKWTLDSDGTLIISGTGAMWENSDPWKEYRGYYPNNNVLHNGYIRKEPINKIIINTGITTVSNGAFENFQSLTKVEIPNTVYSIGNDAFAGCKKLESITIPGSVNSIKQNTFYNCTNLKNINIENGVKYIEYVAFMNCSSLEKINIPSSIIRIENGLFWGCDNLIEITVDNSNAQYSSYDGSLYNKEGDTLIICPQGKKRFEISPNGKFIQNTAFNYCNKLEEIILSDEINFLPSGIFSDCNNLKRFDIPNGVNQLRRTFYKCSNLETVYIPISVKIISSDTFYRCYNLKEIIYAGTQEQWDGIRIDDGNAELGNAKITYLGNSSTTDPEQPDKPTNPDKPATPEKPDTLQITSRPGGLGSKLTVRVEGGHWLTVQVRRAGSIAITSVQAPGTGTVSLTFSAAAGSTVQVWETETEMTFSNGVPNNKILAMNVRNV